MSLITLDSSRFRTIVAAWITAMMAAFGICCTELATRMGMSTPLQCTELGTIMAILLTLPAYAIGDAGILATAVKLQSSFRNGVLSDRVRTGVLFEYGMVFLHAMLLNLLAWYCWKNPGIFVGLATLLAGSNLLWLSLELVRFQAIDRAIGTKGRAALRKSVRGCLDAMPVWIAINGVFICVIAMLFLITLAETSLSREMLSRLTPWIAAIRSLTDLVVCRRYYSDVLTGRYPPVQWSGR